QGELEGRMLQGGVVARHVGLARDAIAERPGPLIPPDIFGADDAAVVAGARRRHGVVEGLGEPVGQPDPGRGREEGGGGHGDLRPSWYPGSWGPRIPMVSTRGARPVLIRVEPRWYMGPHLARHSPGQPAALLTPRLRRTGPGHRCLA